MTRHVKLCGLRRPEDVEAALKAGADDLGFIFYPGSKRNVPLEDASLLRALVPSQRRAIAVVVDADDATLDAIATRFQPDAFQLHGEESPERVREVKERTGRPVIKAIAVRTRADIDAARAYEQVADALLFDTKASDGTSGGTGQSFDWHLMQGFDSTLPWYLSGGLGPDNVAEAIRISGTKRVDASSRLETAPGEKDHALLAAFVAAAKGGY
jgi:phosphoribosylanthranilate isomerase